MTPTRRLPMVVRRAATWLVAIVTAVSAAGCSQLVDGRAQMDRPKLGDPVMWEKCLFTSSNVSPELAKAQCGLLALPLDYANPNGESVTLALIKFPATGAKIGSLVINPGGPGESGRKAAAGLVESLTPQLRERFDLIGFDPRGVGRSRPAVWCNSDEDNDRQRADPTVDYTPEGVAHLDQLSKDFVARCVDKVGKDFLANVGTASVAKDLDGIRAALGDPKLTYLGYSYGTRIGATYAEMFPQNVRAMILDGAIDPNADPIVADLRQAEAFQKAFDDYAADCAKSPDCPLGTDPAKAVEVYKTLVDPLVAKPLPTKDPRGLSYSDALVGTILALYSPSFWESLTAALAEMKTGHGDKMLVLADNYQQRDKNGNYTNASDIRSAVNCVDQPPITDRAKAVEEDRQYRQVAPFLSYGEFTGFAPLSVCAFWPVPPTSTPHTISVPGLPPILVISTTHDPATPYQAGVDLARQLGGGLLTFEGTQHTVALQGETCVDDIVTTYFIDVVVPPPGARC